MICASASTMGRSASTAARSPPNTYAGFAPGAAAGCGAGVATGRRLGFAASARTAFSSSWYFAASALNALISSAPVRPARLRESSSAHSCSRTNRAFIVACHAGSGIADFGIAAVHFFFRDATSIRCTSPSPTSSTSPGPTAHRPRAAALPFTPSPTLIETFGLRPTK